MTHVLVFSVKMGSKERLWSTLDIDNMFENKIINKIAILMIQTSNT